MTSATKTRNSQKKKKPDVERQRLQASIDIFDESIVVTRYDWAGTQLGRSLVEPGDIIKMLGGLQNNAVQWHRPAPGVVAFGTDANGKQRCLVVRPAKRTKIRCDVGNKTKRLDVHMPNLLAELVGEGDAANPRWKQIAAVYCFAGRGGVKSLSNDTVLRVPPLPNVYRTGKICMGSVNVSTWEKLKPAEVFEKAFIETPFTDHILTAPLEESGRKAKYRNVLHALKETRGRVPLGELVRLGTFGELMKGKFNAE